MAAPDELDVAELEFEVTSSDLEYEAGVDASTVSERQQKFAPLPFEAVRSPAFDLDTDEPDVGTVDSDYELSSLNSEDEDDSEDEDEPTEERFYDPEIDGPANKLVLGMKFQSRDEMRDVIKSHLLYHGKEVKFKCIERLRVIAKCKTPRCFFHAYGSRPRHGGPWQLTSLGSRHRKCCGWNENNNKSVTSTWLGRTFADKLRENPDISVKDFRDMLMSELRTDIKRHTAYRAMKVGREIIYGRKPKRSRPPGRRNVGRRASDEPPKIKETTSGCDVISTESMPEDDVIGATSPGRSDETA
ncbi:hypothetical protein M569_11270 [Genlisea aurea]|uniref:Transposase MuDR plant domain-containing protein n=1 Tax=Genlisea aurea TaxID=192259 RepID=S8C9B5_9LAMI|nr:hypothetical protein M569_11270 [Genlisea aurea]